MCCVYMFLNSDKNCKKNSLPTGCLNKERNVSGLAPTSSKKELGRMGIATGMYRRGIYEEKKMILYKLKVCSCDMLLIVTYEDS
jgi:hypothetical protein